MLTTPSVTTFRKRIRDILRQETMSGRRRHVVILALDGIPFDLAQAHFVAAKTTPMQAVFPTTSASVWISALSGLSPDEHGIPGVVFRFPNQDGELINIYTHRKPLQAKPLATIFSDAESAGYRPLSLLGDLAACNCAWRDLLLGPANPISERRFYTAPTGLTPHPDPKTLSRQIRADVYAGLHHYSLGRPCLFWAFVEIDRYIHCYGYDYHVSDVLTEIDRLASALADTGAIVVVHSDHGLTATQQDPSLEALLTRVQKTHSCAMGGAGRTRWLYPTIGGEAQVRDALAPLLPPGVRLDSRDRYFAQGSAAHRRVGPILLIAEGADFITPPGYRFDHGSLTEAELRVPYAIWAA